MTCYQRHLLWLFEALELPYERDERRRVDVALHDVLGLDAGAHCPEVWESLKALDEKRTAALVPEVRAALEARS